MSQQANPRGTFLEIAGALRVRIESDPEMEKLPSLREVMEDHKVSRGVALRAFGVLRDQGVAEPSPGGRWRVLREGADRRPLVERLTDVFETDGLKVGEKFPSASELATRFGAARQTVSKALNRLEAAGWLSEGEQGKARTVLALPDRKEHG